MRNASINEMKDKCNINGFTLAELIVATTISAVVVGILSVGFSFALRVWQSACNQKPDQTFQLACLLKSQLAECDPTPIGSANHATPALFVGQPDSLTFITAHSVKAISKGAPAVVRYVYDAQSKVLYYSEILLDPYHPESIDRFIAALPAGSKENEIQFYGVYFPDFALAYAGRGAGEFSQSWEAPGQCPTEVVLRWRDADASVHTQVCMVNAPFATANQQQATKSGD